MRRSMVLVALAVLVAAAACSLPGHQPGQLPERGPSDVGGSPDVQRRILDTCFTGVAGFRGVTGVGGNDARYNGLGHVGAECCLL